MQDLAPATRSEQSAPNPLLPLTLTERWHYLQGASLFFFVGTLLMDTLLFAFLIPEVLFVAGWVYLAGASSDGRKDWALFLGSVLVGASAMVASAVLTPPALWSWLYLPFAVPFVPAAYAPILIAHAILFSYLATRLAVGQRGPSVLIVVGSGALAFVAIAGLLTATDEYALPPVYFMPIGYALVALGAWRQVHRLRRTVEPESGASSVAPARSPD